MLRPFAIPCLFCLLVATTAADVIHLKNGRSITADRVRESGGKLEYSIGDNTFAIPRSSVASVESIDTATPPNVSSASALPALAEPQADEVNVPRQLVDSVIHHGTVDAEALRAIVAAGPPATAGSAYYVAARFEAAKDDLDAALQDFRTAESLLPDNAIILGHHAATLLRLSRYTEAASLAERSSRLAPKAAFPLAVLGYALYQQNRVKQAISAWEHAQTLQSDDSVQQLLDHARRDLSAQASFQEDASAHFSLRFEGKSVPPQLRQQVLETLEMHFTSLQRSLDYAPHDAVSVILYTDQQFFDVTQAPSWTGAINDGKIRIPMDGVTTVTVDLSRVLKHELAHSFVNQLSRGRCPAWLHEGIAQLLEPRTSVRDGYRLSELYSGQHNLPLNQLESGFSQFSAPEALLGYAQSLATVEYIRDTYGMADIAIILRRIGEGSSTEAALRGTIHSGYAQLEREVTQYLKRNYGD